MSKAWIVAKKEIKDNIKSARFWGLLGLFILLIIVSSYSVGFTFRFGGAAPAERFFRSVGRSLANSFQYIAPIIGIALGFGAIAGEREKGTLRLILSRPIYRDDLLNGKILAGTILILLAIGISFVIGIPITLVLQKANLTGDDLARLLFLLVPAILLALTYYAISLFVSVNTNRSGYALVVAVVVWIFFTFVMPLISAFVASSILGPPPALPTGINATRPAQIPPQLQQYERNYRQITGTVQLISPNSQFNTLANAIFAVQRQQSNIDIGAVIAQNWTAILVPIIYIVVFVVLSYMFFVRRQENK